MGRQQHRFHGDPDRFKILAEYVGERFGNSITYIADVAGGQGMLSRLLNKKYNYICDVIDPRGWTIKGISSLKQEFDASAAEYYDLIVGLHPDEALHAMTKAAMVRPTILIPCCNFWSEEKLGREELLQAIELFYSQNKVGYERVRFSFNGPKNLGFVTKP